MRIAGGIGLVVATVFFCLMLLCMASGAHMQNQVNAFSGFEKVAQSLTGLDKENQARIDGAMLGAVIFFLGMLVSGGVGAVMIGSTFIKKRW
ncbi:MAG TPA: hypothetical protein VHC22_34405 [Pirellulales bacterium]|nr:hypothetical protein [Pirellulales bacterium]